MQQDGIQRHTSQRVYKECTGVLGFFRKTIRKYLKGLFIELPGNPDPFNLDRLIKAFTNKHIGSLKSEREKKVLLSFALQNMQDIRDCALGTEEDRTIFKNAVIFTIKQALYSLDRDCRDDPSARVLCYTCCPENYDDHFQSEKYTLIAAIGHEPDMLIVLDSYFIQIHRIHEKVCFITTDKTHILGKKEIIEETLPGIIIREPGTFLLSNLR